MFHVIKINSNPMCSSVRMMFQMWLGSAPSLTKGPLALFYGGKEILDSLCDGYPDSGLEYVLLVSIIFQLIMYSYEKYKKRQMPQVMHYLRSLQISIIKNVLNVYGVVLVIIFNIIGLFFFLSHLSMIGQENDQLVPEGIYVLAILFVIIVIWPYKSHALRFNNFLLYLHFSNFIIMIIFRSFSARKIRNFLETMNLIRIREAFKISKICMACFLCQRRDYSKTENLASHVW